MLRTIKGENWLSEEEAKNVITEIAQMHGYSREEAELLFEEFKERYPGTRLPDVRSIQ